MSEDTRRQPELRTLDADLLRQVHGGAGGTRTQLDKATKRKA